MDAVIDLDGTVIFSAKAPQADQITVDRYLHGRIGVAHARAIRGISELNRVSRLTVVTTRTPEEYCRLALPERPPALVDNGWHWLPDGSSSDPEWTSEVDSAVGASSDPLSAILDDLTKALGIPSKFRVSVRSQRYVQISAVSGDLTTWTASIQGRLRARGWRADVLGRKVTLLPSAVEKAHLFGRLKERLGGPAPYRAAGDSFMDSDLLAAAVQSRSPRDSQLHRAWERREWEAPIGWRRTLSAGALAGAEILDWLVTDD